MALGALACIILGQISLQQAWAAIDWQVIIYLLGLLVLAAIIETRAFILHATRSWLKYCRNGYHCLALSMLAASISAAVFLNDTIAILGVLFILPLCHKHPRLNEPMLLGLAFSITIGSACSPIGNPQNLLIALQSDMPQVFYQFLHHLGPASACSLILTYAVLAFIYRKTLRQPITSTLISNSCPHRSLLQRVDWGTLIFFMALFILMQSVYDTGFIQIFVQHHGDWLQNNGFVLLSSMLLSLVISNVPVVALYLPVLVHLEQAPSTFLSLAAGSTIAGNAFFFAAASNIILCQLAEKRGLIGPSLLRFSLIGVPLTALQLGIYYYFLH